MKTVHCFTVDVEGFCEGHAESFNMPAYMIRDRREKDEIVSNVDKILELLNRYNIKGTFFVLGVIAEEQPEVVRRIAKEGHEIAFHSYRHLNLFKMDYQAAKEEISRSKKVIEDVLNRRIFGFRTPYFSIKPGFFYIFDIIQESGFVYDSTICSAPEDSSHHFKKEKSSIYKLPNGLIEFSPSTYKIINKLVPALGGGYFRLYPLFVSRFFIKTLQSKNCPAMFYIHPYEIGHRFPFFRNLSLIKKFRYYINVKKSPEKFKHLLEEFTFGRIIDVLQERGFVG